MVGGAAAVLSRRRAAALAAVLAALVALGRRAGVLPERRPLAGRRLSSRSSSCRSRFAVSWLVLPARPSRGVAAARGGPRRCSPSCFDLAGLGSLFNVTKLLALTALGFLFVQAFEALSLGRADRGRSSRGSTRSRCGAARRTTSSRSSRASSTRISVAFRLPGRERRRRTSGRPTSSSSRCSSPRPRASGCGSAWTWLGMVGLLALTLDPRAVFDITGLPALPGDRPRVPAAERRPALAALARARPRAPARGEAHAEASRTGSRLASSSRLTLSMCGVCGNMSTGTQRRARSRSPRAAPSGRPASVVGLHET